MRLTHDFLNSIRPSLQDFGRVSFRSRERQRAERLCALFAATLAFALSAAAQVDTTSWDPAAIRTDRTAPIQLDIQLTSGFTVTGARLDLAAGGSLALSDLGGGHFRASLTPAQALVGYNANSVNHNFAGYLRLLGPGGAVIATQNEFVNVVDANIPPVAVKIRSARAKQSTRILNLYRPGSGNPINDLQGAVREFYSYFPDSFDFVQVVFTLPSSSGNRYHAAVRTDATGTGQSPLNSSADYGSTGRLIGLNVFPIDFFFDTAESTFSHETGHQWINFLQNARLQSAGPHWPPSNMASGVMGFNIPGSNVGGDFVYTVEAASPGFAHVKARAANAPPRTYSDFDLYLMGFIPASQVQNMLILDGDPCADCTVPATTLTIQDVINVNGPRVPSSATAKKSFRIATIVVSRDRPLTDDEMAFFDRFAARGESHVAMPFTSGFATGMTNPFYLATRGLGTVDFRLVQDDPPRRRSIKR